MYEVEGLLKDNRISIVFWYNSKEMFYNESAQKFEVYSMSDNRYFPILQTDTIEEAIKELLKNDLKSIG